MALIEVGECVFDGSLLKHSHGFEQLDPVGREAFVNHIHFEGKNALAESSRIIESWTTEMRERWPTRTFRIYRDQRESEIIIRFHEVRRNVLDWCDQGIEIITVGT